MRIELLGVIVQGMDEQGPDTGVLRHANGTIHSILQQRCAKFHALRPTIHREPAEYHDRHRVWHVAANGAGRELVSDGTSSHGVVTDYAMLFISYHKRPAGAAVLVVHRTAFEPLVQPMLAALEVT